MYQARQVVLAAVLLSTLWLYGCSGSRASTASAKTMSTNAGQTAQSIPGRGVLITTPPSHGLPGSRFMIGARPWPGPRQKPARGAAVHATK